MTTPQTRAEARAAAYELVIDAQTSGSGAREPAMALATTARGAGWHDVHAVADYAVDTVNLWACPDAPDTTAHRESFVAWASRTEDPFARALALCARAAGPHRDDAQRIDDLVAAHAAAEHIDDDVDRSFALHEIGGTFHEMGLWELTREMFAQVEHLTSGLTRPRALVGALALNQHYVLTHALLHARESGDDEALAGAADAVDAQHSAPPNPAVPPQWRHAIAAFAAMSDLLATHRDDGTVAALLEQGPRGMVHDDAVDGLLRCVHGWHELEHGRVDEAAALIRDGARQISDSADPSFEQFVRWLSARVHDPDLQPEARAALRADRTAVVRAREDARHALVRSVRDRMHTGRLRAERDRYARESLTDPLTGLANRRALEARLRGISASSTLMIIDIDRFKSVNDHFGHDVGDQVLRRVGAILLDLIRPGDMAARLGGDEFMVVLESVGGDVAIRRGREVCERVADEPWHTVHDGLRIAASVGVAWGAPDAVSLYRDADHGLYEAKRAGGGRVGRGDLTTGRRVRSVRR